MSAGSEGPQLRVGVAARRGGRAWIAQPDVFQRFPNVRRSVDGICRLAPIGSFARAFRDPGTYALRAFGRRRAGR